MKDSVQYFRDWAADIRCVSRHSADADRIEACANELEELRAKRIRGIGHIHPLVSALGDLIAVFDGHPHLPCEDGELPALDRARGIHGDTVRKLADGLL